MSSLSLALSVLLLAPLAAGTTRQVNPAGQLVYVGTYTTGQSRGIYAFRFDGSAGRLTPLGLMAETRSPSFLVSSGDGRFLFAVNEASNSDRKSGGMVSSFAIDRTTGALTKLSEQPSGGADPCHLALDRTGRFLAVANYTSGTFAMFPVGSDGRLGAVIQTVTDPGRGPNRERQDGPHAHDVVFDAANRFLLGVDLGTDRVLVYRFDAGSGRITPNDPPSASVPPGAGPRHLVFGPGERRAYVINELASTVTTMAWDATNGRLTPGASVTTLPADFSGKSTTAEIALHPNGSVLYGSNRGHDSIAVFRVAGDGTPSTSQIASTRGRTPRHFAMDPGGRWLIAANQDTSSLAIFSVDANTGALTAHGELVNAPSPVCVLFLP
jgi:6-phosphogluconolactonase